MTEDSMTVSAETLTIPAPGPSTTKEQSYAIARDSLSTSGKPAADQHLMPLERKAAFKAAVTMARMSAANAARQLGVSYNHLMLVLNGDRTGSERLCRDIAAFLGRTDLEVFGGRAQRVAPEPQSSTER
jgi:hypothetical protein